MQEWFATIIMFNESQRHSLRNPLRDKDWLCGSANSPTRVALMYGELPPSLSKHGDNYFIIEVALSTENDGKEHAHYQGNIVTDSELSAAVAQRRQLEHDIINLGGLKQELSQKETEAFCQLYAQLCTNSQGGSNHATDPKRSSNELDI